MRTSFTPFLLVTVYASHESNVNPCNPVLSPKATACSEKAVEVRPHTSVGHLNEYLADMYRIMVIQSERKTIVPSCIFFCESFLISCIANLPGG